MPQEAEADTMSDAGLKAFDPNSKSGKPLSAPVDVAFELGLTDTTSQQEETEEKSEADSEQKKSDEKGKKVVDNYSAKIQEESEQLYEIRSYRAKTEDGYLDKLIAGDPTDQKFAKKILDRNSEHFGASTIEEYKVKRAKEQAGDDPTAQAIAEMKAKQEVLEANQKSKAWDEWKKENSVTGEVAKIADQLHEQNPSLAFGLVIDAARGRMGIGEGLKDKEAGSTAVGSSPAPQSEEVNMSSPLAKALLRKVDLKSTKKFAKSYQS